MKRFPAALLAALLLLAMMLPSALAASPRPDGVYLFDAASGGYVPISVRPVGLSLNGEPLEGEAPALQYQGQTLVPVRLLGEALGAEVEWPSPGQALVTLGSRSILFTLGSAQAAVDGATTDLPGGAAVRTICYRGAERTMVPLRFLAEQLGASVSWDEASSTVLVTASLPTEQPPAWTVTDIDADDDAQTVFIATDGAAEFRYEDYGNRAVVDVLDATLESGFPATVSMENEIFSAVRYAEHVDLYGDGTHTVRVVLDLREGYTCSENVEVERQSGGILIRTHRESGQVTPPNVPDRPGASVVVLDAGHGGTDTGALYEGIREKDLNLAVTQKVAAILSGLGCNVVLTRNSDTYIGLYERAELANRVDADLFVSIHSNANDSPDIHGVSTYSYPTSLKGGELARAVQNAAAEASGAKNRGVLTANFVVLRETSMPACLVEMGFMTNHDELMLLATDSYQDKLAQGIANGIVQYLRAQA